MAARTVILVTNFYDQKCGEEQGCSQLPEHALQYQSESLTKTVRTGVNIRLSLESTMVSDGCENCTRTATLFPKYQKIEELQRSMVRAQDLVKSLKSFCISCPSTVQCAQGWNGHGWFPSLPWRLSANAQKRSC
jgi:hypothetical protein